VQDDATVPYALPYALSCRVPALRLPREKEETGHKETRRGAMKRERLGVCTGWMDGCDAGCSILPPRFRFDAEIHDTACMVLSATLPCCVKEGEGLRSSVMC
jgi:hypothetical protein